MVCVFVTPLKVGMVSRVKLLVVQASEDSTALVTGIVIQLIIHVNAIQAGRVEGANSLIALVNRTATVEELATRRTQMIRRVVSTALGHGWV